MRLMLFKMFLRGAQGGRTNIPVIGVFVLLTLGVGVFWLVQILLSNFLAGLTRSVLSVKEEIAVYRNPLYREADGGGSAAPGDDFIDRMRLDDEEVAEAAGIVTRAVGMTGSPMIKRANFTFQRRQGQLQTVLAGTLVGMNLDGGPPVLPALDQLGAEAVHAFTHGDDDIIPLLVSRNLLPDLNPGDLYEMDSGGQTWRFRITALLQQDHIFSVPLLVVPLPAAKRLVETETADFIAVRVLTGNSFTQGDRLKTSLDNAAKGKYLVQHWSEPLRIIHGIFRAINLVISTVVSSLFLIAFFFAVALFDIVLRRRRRNIALLLALGMKPKTIRNTVVMAGSLLGICAFVLGFGLCLALLAVIPLTQIGETLAAAYITDYSFAFSWTAAVMALFLSLATAVGSTWYSSRRVFYIDPVEDLRT